MGTEEAARRIGMSSEWVRRQILAGRLEATAYRTGSRATYRITARALREFLRRYARLAGPLEPR